jgi:hypothetical protein
VPLPFKKTPMVIATCKKHNASDVDVDKSRKDK